jgi:hypothetical protein
MGIAIAKVKRNSQYHGHANPLADFATDASARLVPDAGESFELMPTGSLDVLAFSRLGNHYNQNPYAAPGMRWEIGFSNQRLSLFSPQTNTLLGGVNQREGQATLGFNYYIELHSLSLVPVQDVGGPYVSMVFIIQATPKTKLPLGIRMHGEPVNLSAFATMLAVRFIECFSNLGATHGLDISPIGKLFELTSGFDFTRDAQTDLFIVAGGSTLEIKVGTPPGHFHLPLSLHCSSHAKHFWRITNKGKGQDLVLPRDCLKAAYIHA